MNELQLHERILEAVGLRISWVNAEQELCNRVDECTVELNARAMQDGNKLRDKIDKSKKQSVWMGLRKTNDNLSRKKCPTWPQGRTAWPFLPKNDCWDRRAQGIILMLC